MKLGNSRAAEPPTSQVPPALQEKKLVVEIPKAHTSPPPMGQTGLGASLAARKLCTQLSHPFSACPGLNMNASALKGFLSPLLCLFPTLHPPFSDCEKPLPFLGRLETITVRSFWWKYTERCLHQPQFLERRKVRARNKEFQRPRTPSISRHFLHEFPGCNPFPPRRLRDQAAATPFGAGGGARV